MKSTLLVLVSALSLAAAADTPYAGAPAWTGRWAFDGSLSDASGNGQDACAVSPVPRGSTRAKAEGWGDGAAMVALLEKVIRREGIGDVLADGVKAAAAKIGRGAEACAMHVGGQEPGLHSALFLPSRGTGFVCDPTPGRQYGDAVPPKRDPAVVKRPSLDPEALADALLEVERQRKPLRDRKSTSNLGLDMEVGDLVIAGIGLACKLLIK